MLWWAGSVWRLFWCQPFRFELSFCLRSPLCLCVSAPSLSVCLCGNSLRRHSTQRRRHAERHNQLRCLSTKMLTKCGGSITPRRRSAALVSQSRIPERLSLRVRSVRRRRRAARRRSCRLPQRRPRPQTDSRRLSCSVRRRRCLWPFPFPFAPFAPPPRPGTRPCARARRRRGTARCSTW